MERSKPGRKWSQPLSVYRAFRGPRRCCSRGGAPVPLSSSSASILACTRLISCVVAFSICVLVSILAALMSCVEHARVYRTQDKSWIVGYLPLDLPALRDG
jgi:hypothetical protein